ncbi:hypothetical protein AVEN_111179-1 [Araneus ventricosus]|uniref:Uncharacterized protein n=1 Tax=Araneus ventricosus TaxID=182803 RepID=A0A4Y2QM63_ARAVE|nr:hypothetical protein AVEN_111179-1 [Araneus ventricosus]
MGQFDRNAPVKSEKPCSPVLAILSSSSSSPMKALVRPRAIGTPAIGVCSGMGLDPLIGLYAVPERLDGRNCRIYLEEILRRVLDQRSGVKRVSGARFIT